MPGISAEVVVQQQWTQLMTILHAQMVVGGRLAALKDLRKSIQLWAEVMPAAGVQLIRYDEEKYGQRQHLVRSHFQIAVATKSIDSTIGTTFTPANLDDAMAQLMPLCDDGNGNGIGAILRDPANYTLGGSAQESRVLSFATDWNIGPGETPEILAYGIFSFVAEKFVSI